LPIFVETVMPKYNTGVPAAQVIILGIAIYSSTILYGNIFTILRLNKQLLTNSIFLSVFNIIFSVLLVLIVKRDIVQVAYGTVISYALYSFLLILRLKKISGLSIGTFVITSWLPVLITLILCLVFNSIPVNLFIKFGMSIGFYSVIILILYREKLKNLFQMKEN